MKINLQDIMESLNSGNEADAQVALHEWFVEHGKRIQSGQLDEDKIPANDAAAEKKADGSENPSEVEDEVNETVEADEDAEEISEAVDDEDHSEDKEEVEESFDDLVADLTEAFKGLETVSDKLQNVEGAQVGEQGKVSVNTKSTLPNHKGADRLAGSPVEVKDKPHTGHEREKAPAVQDIKIKNTVQNGKEELKKVASKGDASALLNKMDGTVNTQSPISGKGAKGLKK